MTGTKPNIEMNAYTIKSFSFKSYRPRKIFKCLTIHFDNLAV